MKRILFVMMAVVCGVCAYSQSKVVAHRGYWKTEGSAQNSIRALVKADSIGCWGSEFDVWMTADGKLVVCHDERIDRTSNGSGAIAALSYEKLVQYNYHA